MAKTIFSGDVSSALQTVINKYEVCRAIFTRARDINSRAQQTGGQLHNAPATALTEYTDGRIIARVEEETEKETSN